MDGNKDVAAIILAAGEGTRMKSNIAKVLHKVCGKTMIRRVVETVSKIEPSRFVVVVGHQAESVKAELEGEPVEFAVQARRLGTAHAVLSTGPILKGFDGVIIVLNGDTPLLRAETLSGLIDHHVEQDAVVTVLTAVLDDPTGYGRIVRDTNGSLMKIIEEKDASEDEKKISEINSGIFCFDGGEMFEALRKVDRKNAQGEYYLTDVVGILKGEGKMVSAFRSDQKDEILGINTLDQLREAERLMHCG
ncbi:MAG: UDP-N-acetylglucosamine pyrophosphorylase [Candidatus Latescibacteria bacterium 4484_7]|nr:MAG: UDP-N-acetylglucosamine pyrophosphorylase [Candidatus Latescibacteria bacterium 4484_7]